MVSNPPIDQARSPERTLRAVLWGKRLRTCTSASDPGTTKIFSELEQSALKETANILTGAYLNALSDFLGVMLLPSVPSLAVDLCAAVLSTTYLNFGQDRDRVIILDTRFRFEPGDHSLSGHFVLLPDPSSLEVILKAIRLV